MASSLPILLVGTDHRNAPIELREKVSYGADEAERTLVHLLAREEIAEAYLLSTCNRTEVYVVAQGYDSAYRTAAEVVFVKREAQLEELGHLYVQRGDQAARHLLRVASGLESMVLGEPEILGQVKTAAGLAESIGAAGPLLQKLQRYAARAGARARSETAIGTGAVSLGYATVELARVIFDRLGDLRILIVGAGETARLVARNLIDKGASRVRLANRGQERAAALRAELPTIEIVPFGDLAAQANDSDLLVTTTSADESLLSQEDLPVRRSRPLLVVDLGVPRNVEPAVGRLENVFLHTVDSLETLIQKNLKRRREEVAKVEELIEEELAQYLGWARGLAAEPMIEQLQKKAEAIRQRELLVAQARFPTELHDEVDRLTRSLVRKILHNPSAHLRGQGRTEGELELIRELFRLDGDE
ncbi:MAG: glutamyl-tRNA reductase [Acidobacteriota bacterium]